MVEPRKGRLDMRASSTLAILLFTALALGVGSGCGTTDPRDEGPMGVSGQELVGDCTAAVVASPASPQPSGTTVNFNASGSCNGGAPEFKTWLRPNGGSWGVLCDWQATSTCSWSTTGLSDGTYQVQVWSRTQGSGLTYEGTTTVQNYSIGAAGGTCTVGLSTSPAAPQSPGTNVTISATGGSCTGGTPEYKFWRQPPGGAWQVQCDWQTGTTCAWDSTGAVQGTHKLQIWARAQGSASMYEGYSLSGKYDLVDPGGVCNAATLTPSPASPQYLGTQISLTGAATCTGTAVPEYKFWVQLPGQAWTILRDWGSSATTNWNTNTATAGTSRVQVWTRAYGSTASYEGYSSAQSYVLNGAGGTCTAVTLGFNPTSPQAAGTSVAVSGTATCDGTAVPSYRYFRRIGTGPWTDVSGGWVTGDYTWDTTGGTGVNQWQVWTRALGSTATYEAYSLTANYTVN